MKYWLATLLLLCVSPNFAAIIIGEITFNQDFAISDTELLQASGLSIGQEYQAEKVAQAVAGIQSYLQAKGEYYVRIPNPELSARADDTLRLSFTLQAVAQSSKTRIRYTGLKHFSESILHSLAYTSEDAEYPLAQMPIYMQRILELYAQRAYLFARVELDSLVIQDGLTAYIRIDEGKVFEAKKYHFSGNKITRETSILKNSGLLGQKIITPAKLQQAEQNLKAKPYILESRIVPVDAQSLLFDIQEGRMTYLEGVLGLSEDRGKRRVSGLLKINFQNLWGSDRAISLFWRSNPSQYSELRFSYHESGHPALPLAADFTLARSNQDSLWIQSTVGAELYYQSLYQKYGISASSRTVLPGSGTSNVVKAASQRVGAFWSFQSTMGERIPTQGLELEAGYHYIFAAGPNNGAIEISGLLYQPIKGRFIGHLGLHLRSYEKPELASYDLYRMGGFRSLRGFREDEFKSWRLGWVNSELRYMLGPQSMLYCFYDHGFIASGKTKIQADIFALGAGISLGTRVGILSLGYGLPYRDKKLSDIGLGMVHMGLDIAL